MFSQQLCCGMERDCYCCRPGPSLPTTAPVPYLFEPHSIPRQAACPQPQTMPLGPVSSLGPLKISTSQCGAMPQLGPTVSSRQENKGMDVDLALSELDDLQMSTGYGNDGSVFQKDGVWSSGAGESGEAHDMHPGRRGRYRSFSESTSAMTQGLKQSSSESSLYKAAVDEPAVAAAATVARMHGRRWLAMGGKPGSSLSLPRKISGYHMVQRNSAYVSDISTGRADSGCPWDSGVSSFSEQSSLSDSSPPCSMGVYRNPDLLEERPRLRRFSRVHLERMRRLRQPYSIPFRMCQSMNEDSTASLQDFLSTISISQPPSSSATSPPTSKSSSASPQAKPDGLAVAISSGSTLKRSQSIDNLELSRLRQAESAAAEPARPSLLARSRETLEMEQVASNFKNLHLQLD